jgi:NAD(P)-dependent dehydrogenase (short-subunit alcohol dehydrogenase family)/acyl carrier protein
MLLRSVDQTVYQSEFSVDSQWVLAEHQVLGEALVPGSTYLEMAQAAATEHFGRPTTELADVEFLVPMLVGEGRSRVVHTTIRDRGDGGADFSIAARESGEQTEGAPWTVHARGSVYAGTFEQPAPWTDPGELRERCGRRSIDAGAHQDRHAVMTFGRRWRESLRTVWVGDRAALARLDLPADYVEEAAQHSLHPALLDLATGISAFVVLDGRAEHEDAGTDREFFLPLGYDSVRLYRPLPARGLSLMVPNPEYIDNGEVRKMDVLVCDDSGAVAVEITGFTTKLVADPQRTVARLRSHSRHHAVRWAPAPLSESGVGPAPARVLMVGEPGSAAPELAGAFRAAGSVAVEASVEGPPPDTGAVDALVFVAAPADDRAQQDPARLQTRLESGVYRLFDLARHATRHGTMPGRIGVIAPYVARVTGRESGTAPVHAALFGLAKVIGEEYPGVDVRCLDIDSAGADEICANLLAPRSPVLVALRDGHRYEPVLEPADLRDRPEATPEGTYLITGGLGGLGLSVARHLSRTIPGVRLALAGRSGPRDRHAVALQDMRAGGAVVRCYRADVADPQAVARLVEQVRSDLGRIGCIVHAAGLAGDGFLFHKDPVVFRATLAGKVLGAVALDAATADDPPDLMLNFGSTVSVFGAAGQSDYTAANSYLDQFAEYRSAAGRRTVTALWSDWRSVGMAFDHGVLPDQGYFRSLSIPEGLASFDELLTTARPVVIVGEVNRTRAGHGQREPEPDRAARSGSGRATPPLRLIGREEGGYSETERRVGEVWAAEFGLAELDVRESSFALGADSLTALRMVQELQKVLGARVSVADLFQRTTVEDLARHLDEQARTQEWKAEPR